MLCNAYGLFMSPESFLCLFHPLGSRESWLSFRKNRKYNFCEPYSNKIHDFAAEYFKIYPAEGSTPFWLEGGSPCFPLYWVEGPPNSKQTFNYEELTHEERKTVLKLCEIASLGSGTDSGMLSAFTLLSEYTEDDVAVFLDNNMENSKKLLKMAEIKQKKKAKTSETGKGSAAVAAAVPPPTAATTPVPAPSAAIPAATTQVAAAGLIPLEDLKKMVKAGKAPASSPQMSEPAPKKRNVGIVIGAPITKEPAIPQDNRKRSFEQMSAAAQDPVWAKDVSDLLMQGEELAPSFLELPMVAWERKLKEMEDCFKVQSRTLGLMSYMRKKINDLEDSLDTEQKARELEMGLRMNLQQGKYLAEQAKKTAEEAVTKAEEDKKAMEEAKKKAELALAEAKKAFAEEKEKIQSELENQRAEFTQEVATKNEEIDKLKSEVEKMKTEIQNLHGEVELITREKEEAEQNWVDEADEACKRVIAQILFLNPGLDIAVDQVQAQQFVSNGRLMVMDSETGQAVPVNISASADPAPRVARATSEGGDLGESEATKNEDQSAQTI